jgi:hypothetical protein
METSASYEARSAPSLYPTAGPKGQVPASVVTSAGTSLPAPSGVASDNLRRFGNLVDYPPPARETQRLPPNASESCATKRLPHSTRRAGSWSSCADDTAVALVILFQTRIRSPIGSTGPPRQTRSKPDGHPEHSRRLGGSRKFRSGR